MSNNTDIMHNTTASEQLSDKMTPAEMPEPPDKEALLSLIARRAFDADHECLFLIDPASGKARKLWQSDPSASLFPTSFDYTEVIADYFTRYCYEKNPQEIIRQTSIATMQSMLRIQDIYSITFYVTGPDHRLLHKKATCFYTDETKETISLLIRDTTKSFADERDRYLELQKALDETRAIAKANTRFLKLFNRDMRTPIHSILGLAEIADSEVQNPDVIRDYLYKIKSAGSSMSEIIDDILVLSRIIQSPPTPHPETISLKKWLGFLQSALAEKLHYRGLTLHFDIQDDMSEEVVTDAYFLNITLQKLLIFAVNNTVRGGEIHLSVQELLQKQHKTLMEFTVISHGIDLHPEQIENLFRPNEYLMNELSSDLSSVDLNTVILKYYVAALGGTIVGHIGAGTPTMITVSLNFLLPEKIEPPVPEQASPRIPDLHQYNALIVDDDPINLEVGTKLLARTGIHTISESNGLDALLAVQDSGGKLDVILVDIRMPGMDGLEVARRIRQMPLPYVQKVPIIAMTVNDSDEDLKMSLKAGINAHLIKPIEPSDLYSVLSKFLS